MILPLLIASSVILTLLCLILIRENRRARAREGSLKQVLNAARIILWRYDIQRSRLTVELDVPSLNVRAPAGRLSIPRALARVHPEDRRTLWRRIVAAEGRGELSADPLRVLIPGSANPLWMENHITVERDCAGSPLALCGALVDITSHKRARDALAERDRRKDAFLATLAHELRNPVAAVGTMATLLEDTELGARESGSCIRTIRRQARQLSRLTDDLLDLGRIIHDRLGLERETVELRSAVEESVEDVQWLVQRRGLSIGLSLPEDPLYLHADRERLLQAFGNLLANAVKYTPAGGRIEVSLEAHDRLATIGFRDNGIGIPPAEQARVFDPFHQVSTHVPLSQGGLGIGLALVRRIIELHGGTVELRSAGTGTGSEFIVRVPLSTPFDGRRQAAVPMMSRPRRVARILLADDNVDVANATARALKLYGHVVRIARDGAEAVRIADEFHPDIVLLDIGMPLGAGDEVARVLRTRSWARDSVLVALTGWSLRDLRSRADLSAFDSHLVKPTSVETINGLIHRTRHGSNPRPMPTMH